VTTKKARAPARGPRIVFVSAEMIPTSLLKLDIWPHGDFELCYPDCDSHEGRDIFAGAEIVGPGAGAGKKGAKRP